MTPALNTVLSRLDQVDLALVQRHAFAQVCLSASNFGQLDWKERMLLTAKMLAGDNPPLWLKQSLDLSNKLLDRMKGKIILPGIPEEVQPPGLSRRENGGFGLWILADLKLYLEQDAPIAVIEACQRRFRPLDGGTSTQEDRITVASRGIIARARKNHGDFNNAFVLYETLVHESKARSWKFISHDLLANQAETLCDVGWPDRAAQMLQHEAGSCMGIAAPRMHLALANCWLAVSLVSQLQRGAGCPGLGSLDEHLKKARTLFSQYLGGDEDQDKIDDLTSTNEENQYVALAGLAMVDHLAILHIEHTEGPLSSVPLVAAAQAWTEARQASGKCWPTPGFARMLTLYSESEIMFRLGRKVIGERLNEEARAIFLKTGRRFRLPIQGTLWMDLMNRRLPTEKRMDQIQRVELPIPAFP